jgi:DNA repair exonuclease SbcCD ATPase subunit
MSSTDPFAPLSGAERWTAPLDALRQRQKELVNRIAQIQKQAAQPLPTKTPPPSPAATAPALHDKFTDQFNKATATVQQQQAAYKDAVAKGDLAAAHGHLTAARDAWQQVLGAGEIIAAGFEYASKQEAARQAELDALAKRHAEAAQNANEVVQSMRDMIEDVRQKLGEILQAQSQVESKIWS